jgi:hypothetical protein
MKINFDCQLDWIKKHREVSRADLWGYLGEHFRGGFTKRGHLPWVWAAPFPQTGDLGRVKGKKEYSLWVQATGIFFVYFLAAMMWAFLLYHASPLWWTETSETVIPKQIFSPFSCLAQEFCHINIKLTNIINQTCVGLLPGNWIGVHPWNHSKLQSGSETQNSDAIIQKKEESSQWSLFQTCSTSQSVVVISTYLLSQAKVSLGQTPHLFHHFLLDSVCASYLAGALHIQFKWNYTIYMCVCVYNYIYNIYNGKIKMHIIYNSIKAVYICIYVCTYVCI